MLCGFRTSCGERLDAVKLEVDNALDRLANLKEAQPNVDKDLESINQKLDTIKVLPETVAGLQSHMGLLAGTPEKLGEMCVDLDNLQERQAHPGDGLAAIQADGFARLATISVLGHGPQTRSYGSLYQARHRQQLR